MDARPNTRANGRKSRRRQAIDHFNGESTRAPRRRRTEVPNPDGGTEDTVSFITIPTTRPNSPPTLEGAPCGVCAASASAQMENGSALEPRDVFPFMELPAELRVNIYRMALQRDEALLLHLQRTAEQDDNKISTDTSVRSIPMILRTLLPDSDAPPESMPTPLQKDCINPALLRTCKQVYKEARQVLYSDNNFVLSLTSGIHTLSNLHQRSRSLIKSVSLTIPSHHDILDGFADLVRLGLRYCWGLKKFTIILSTAFPDDRVINGASSVYANAFHILRWLPKGCKVVLDGNVSEVVKNVVAEEGRLQEQLDETSYLKRQHQMPERH